jgi:translation initiation factor 4G
LFSFFSGVLHQIFECLYDIDVVSEEALLAWESCDDPAELEGKGVAIKSTTQFFTWLKEADDDDED